MTNTHTTDAIPSIHLWADTIMYRKQTLGVSRLKFCARHSVGQLVRLDQFGHNEATIICQLQAIGSPSVLL